MDTIVAYVHRQLLHKKKMWFMDYFFGYMTSQVLSHETLLETLGFFVQMSR